MNKEELIMAIDSRLAVMSRFPTKRIDKQEFEAFVQGIDEETTVFDTCYIIQEEGKDKFAFLPIEYYNAASELRPFLEQLLEPEYTLTLSPQEIQEAQSAIIGILRSSPDDRVMLSHEQRAVLHDVLAKIERAQA